MDKKDEELLHFAKTYKPTEADKRKAKKDSDKAMRKYNSIC